MSPPLVYERANAALAAAVAATAELRVGFYRGAEVAAMVERAFAVFKDTVSPYAPQPATDPIPVGEAQDSDFGTFLDEVRK